MPVMTGTLPRAPGHGVGSFHPFKQGPPFMEDPPEYPSLSGLWSDFETASPQVAVLGFRV